MHIVTDTRTHTRRSKAQPWDHLRHFLWAAAELVKDVPVGLLAFRRVQPDQILLVDISTIRPGLRKPDAGRWEDAAFRVLCQETQGTGVAEALWKAAEEGEQFTRTVFRTENGRVREVVYKLRPFHMAPGHFGLLIEDVTAQQQVQKVAEALALANQRLLHLSITDDLTGLYNHRHLQTSVVREVERSLRTGLPLSLLMLDIDHFKRLNDERGHLAGDAVLHRLGQMLAEGLRLNDVVARYGGEEFALLLVDTRCSAAVQVAERLRTAIAEEHFTGADHEALGTVTVSIGLACCPVHAREAKGVLAAADAALYRAKRGGRNRVEMAPDPVALRVGGSQGA